MTAVNTRPPAEVDALLAATFTSYDAATPEQRADLDDRRMVPVPELRRLLEKHAGPRWPQHSRPLPGTVTIPTGITLGSPSSDA